MTKYVYILHNVGTDAFLYISIAIIASVGFLTGKCDCRTNEQLKAIHSCDDQKNVEKYDEVK